MIHFAEGNILNANAEALVNTVNCVGVMGKGIALQFKKAYPKNFKLYEKACRHHEVMPGKMLIFQTELLSNPKFIINFPTKRDWKHSSRYEDIESGLTALADEIQKLQIKSIAIPPLGCGLGGLDWKKVKPMIEHALNPLPDVLVYLFEPKGLPEANVMPIQSEKKLTPARALFIELIQIYKRHDYRLTLLEIQKLAYFLQEAGYALKLNYIKHIYGPYAHNLNKVLEVLEGHYIQGYGDNQKPDVEINLLPKAHDEAVQFITGNAIDREPLMKVSELVEGFETPYGLELLSSIHWLSKHDHVSAKEDMIFSELQKWNVRKKNLFKKQHVQVALEHLHDQHWI